MQRCIVHDGARCMVRVHRKGSKREMELAEGVDLQLCEELGEGILVLGMPTDGVQIKFSLEYACYKHSKKK